MPDFAQLMGDKGSMPRHCSLGFALLAVVSITWVATPARAAQTEKKKSVTVADTIRMTTVPEIQYAAEDTSNSRIALFSPDNKRFVMVTERGLLETNEREFSLLMFQADELFRSPRPNVLITMRSRSNRDAIRNVRWIDNGSLVFLGEAHDTSQVYSLRIAGKRLNQLTNHPTPIVDFAFNLDAREVVYAAEPEPLSTESAYRRCAHGYAITNQALDDIPRSMEDCKQPSLLEGLEVHAKKEGHAAVRVPFVDCYMLLKPISISPTGKYAIFGVLLRKVPPGWKDYEDPYIRAEALASRNRGPFSWVPQYVLIDTSSAQTRPLLDGPIEISQGAPIWSPGGKSVVISGAFLPLDATDPVELAARKAHSFVVEVDLVSGTFTKVSDKQLIAARWDADTNELLLRAPERNPERGKALFRKTGSAWVEAPANSAPGSAEHPIVTLEQDLNSPPKVFASDGTHLEKELILDLNPQFKDFEFGKVERVTWKAKDGHEVEGGLYYPPQYKPGTRYPLVIQTHAFSKDEFWINGPWNSAFAAQPLAARDIVVLQVGGATEKGADARVLRTPEEAPRQMGVYEGAIDYLDGLGIIDRTRVGIIGFSRTVYSVEYTLTHSSYHFAAATAADGFDGGYLQYLVNPYAKRDWMTVNGGDPFGTTFELWRERSPSFTVDRLHAPVRLEGYGNIGAVIGNWEWYAKLVMLDRPVDLVYLPDGTHLLVKPWERLTSQQGNVDWFCFWLKEEEDPDPAKAEQYTRWRELRRLQEASAVGQKPN
jgi:dipeptidyl aminopeptidase/acylaminoacyl peptidase